MPGGKSPSGAPRQSLAKCPSGIRGLDEIINGGLPRGRPTELCGGPGCGKILFACSIEIIDLLENPQLARDQIVAIPALVRMLPPPLKKIIGDLSARERGLAGLGLRPRAA